MFPELPSFRADDEFLHTLGRAGGVCDCGDLEDTPDSLSDTAAGWPIFGQFVAHDITADRSILRSHTNVEELNNARSPQLNLECLYGDGPVGHPFLYQRSDPAKFVLGHDEVVVPCSLTRPTKSRALCHKTAGQLVLLSAAGQM
jgi:hypothetical protein